MLLKGKRKNKEKMTEITRKEVCMIVITGKTRALRR
tara:strand:+ start:320 stop:427 length:108 start_codon:yes stop_codon:yes gene_type:complete